MRISDVELLGTLRSSVYPIAHEHGHPLQAKMTEVLALLDASSEDVDQVTETRYIAIPKEGDNRMPVEQALGVMRLMIAEMVHAWLYRGDANDGSRWGDELAGTRIVVDMWTATGNTGRDAIRLRNDPFNEEHLAMSGEMALLPTPFEAEEALTGLADLKRELHRETRHLIDELSRTTNGPMGDDRIKMGARLDALREVTTRVVNIEQVRESKR